VPDRVAYHRRQFAVAEHRGCALTVVRRETGLRWLAVGVTVALLASLPQLVRMLPVDAAAVPVRTLVARIAASATVAYQGYAVSTGNAGIPSLPQLDDVTGLFDGDTSLRIWYASPGRWRVDTIDLAGERDVYHSAAADTVWDYGEDQMISVVGKVQLRLPRGADLTPPDLARRVLAAARSTGPGRPDAATYTALPDRGIAGMAAAGVRLTPTDRQTTVGHIDIWADPRTGLPLEVDIVARGVATPALASRMLDVQLGVPDDATMTPPSTPPGAGTTVTTNPDIGRVLRNLGLGDLPDRVGGLTRTDSGLGVLSGIGAYGTGFRQLVAVSLPVRLGFNAYQQAVNVGGTEYPSPDGDIVIVTTPLVGVMIVEAHRSRSIFIVAGLVGADVLQAFAKDLITYAGPVR
jgi:hypothetical protein